MKNAIKILALLASFGAGFAAGYFVRKRSELTIEEVTEEELQDAVKGLSEAQEDVSSDIHEEESEDTVEAQEDAVESDSEGIGEGQKIAYFKKWKADAALDKYSTFTTEEPEDVVSEVEDLPDDDFINSLNEDDIRPEIEAGTIEDWNHWIGLPDGEYDAIEIRWYEHDNVICDDQDTPLDNPEKFIGFDIRKRFEKIDPNTTGDENVRVLINHRYRVVYHVTRIFGSYGDKKRAEEFEDYDDPDGGDSDEDIYDRFRGLRN